MRMHVNIRVADLDRCVRFYSELFGSAPSLRRHDYAKWSLEEPRVNFALVAGKEGRLEHLGIEAECPEELEALRFRARRAGAEVREEKGALCCYARSDKAWVEDVQGMAWELFYTHGQVPDAPTAAGSSGSAAAAGACCAPDCCAGGAS